MEKTYNIAYRHSNDGKSWSVCSSNIKATTEAEAKAKLKKKYKYVDNIRIQSVK